MNHDFLVFSIFWYFVLGLSFVEERLFFYPSCEQGVLFSRQTCLPAAILGLQTRPIILTFSCFFNPTKLHRTNYLTWEPISMLTSYRNRRIIGPNSNSVADEKWESRNFIVTSWLLFSIKISSTFTFLKSKGGMRCGQDLYQSRECCSFV